MACKRNCAKAGRDLPESSNAKQLHQHTNQLRSNTPRKLIRIRAMWSEVAYSPFGRKGHRTLCRVPFWSNRNARTDGEPDTDEQRGIAPLSRQAFRARPAPGSWKSARPIMLKAEIVAIWGPRTQIWTKIGPAGMARQGASRHGIPKPPPPGVSLISQSACLPRNRKDTDFFEIQ